LDPRSVTWRFFVFPFVSFRAFGFLNAPSQATAINVMAGVASRDRLADTKSDEHPMRKEFESDDE
jgi:hypothetical protein